MPRIIATIYREEEKTQPPPPTPDSKDTQAKLIND